MNRRRFMRAMLALAAPIGVCGYGLLPLKLKEDMTLSEASLERMLIEISRYTDERGLRINVMPTMVYVTEEHIDAARQLLARTAWQSKRRHERIMARGGYHTLPRAA